MLLCATLCVWNILFVLEECKMTPNQTTLAS